MSPKTPRNTYFFSYKKLVLRTPLMPYTEEFDEKIIQAQIHRPEVREALFIASPTIYEQVLQRKSPEIPLNNRELISVYKYLSRMSIRATPFGLFSGCSVAEWADQSTSLKLNSHENINRVTSIDMEYLCRLASVICNTPELNSVIKYFPNSSILRCGKKMRLTKIFYKQKYRRHSISEIDHSRPLETLLKLASEGKTKSQLAEILSKKINDVSFAEASEFIAECISEQVLVSELEPNVTGKPLHERLLMVLNYVNHPFGERLNEIERILKNLDKKIYNSPESYYPIFDNLDELGVDYDKSRTLQVNSYRVNKTPLVISSKVKDEITDALLFLKRISRQGYHSGLKKFSEKFIERYGTHDIPLLEVLDPVYGIGFPVDQILNDDNPLIEGLPVSSQQERSIALNQYDIVLNKLLSEAIKDNQNNIDLTDSSLPQNEQPFNNNCGVHAVFKLISAEEILLKIVTDDVSTKIIGRFAGELSEIEQLVTEITNDEISVEKDKICAEIVHLPEDRLANVLSHPSFYKYEIPFLARPGVSNKHQVCLSDLFISIRDNRIILKSRLLKKEIIPKLSNAHNYNKSPHPVYKFLASLQYQDKAGSLDFSWGNLEKLYNYFPRVTFRNIILCEAYWTLSQKDYQFIISDKEANLIPNLLILQQKFSLPDKVLLCHGDNELYIDFRNKVAAITFLKELKKASGVKLKEFIFDPVTCPVVNSKGEAYLNEFIATFRFINNNSNLKLNELTPFRLNKFKQKQAFQPASEWLYYKLYTSTKSSDYLLSDKVSQLVKFLKKRGLISSWFFIRYTDPDFHLRIRFEISSADAVNEIIATVSDFLTNAEKDRLIWKVIIDRYEREIERYGQETMKLSEQFFYLDSECIINFIKTFYGDILILERWKFAIFYIDYILELFKLNQSQKLDFCRKMSDLFGLEFGINRNKSLKVSLDQKYKKHRDTLNFILTNKGLYNIKQHSAFNKVVTQIMQKLGDSDSLKYDLLSSFIHMSINRLFEIQNRKNEFACYQLLYKYYKSKEARSKHNTLHAQEVA